ncbi:FAD/NAD(P)-binding protein [Parafrankia elaeagni]|uniref:FAD/NAD(P)-binding protein n=1 Tax=Parafrankia elaeagni TaxID=222534 RepID=UPI000360458E|nr:FAD/NAD(P)-binding protein [Parafrankia elaeagni]
MSIGTRPGAEAAALAGPAVSAQTPRLFRVADRVQESPDTWTLRLVPGDGGVPVVAAPGQFTMLYAFGVGEVPLSVSSLPSEVPPLLHTVRAVGAVTEAICATRPGGMLGVRGPFGRGWPLDEIVGRDVLLVAGGLGLAPLRPVVQWILRRRDEVGRVALLVGSRTPADVLYHADLAELAARPDVQVLLTVDAADPGWKGRVGVVTALLPQARFDPARTVALTCGPEIMMRLTAQALVDAGIPAHRVHLSMERNMHCGVGHCGRCQLGPLLLCLDGPVCDYGRLGPLLLVREL